MMPQDAFGDAWRAMRRTLFGRSPKRAETKTQPEPLCIYRLERRRMLSANFSLAGGGLVLDGFAAGGSDSLAISETPDAYRFETTGGWHGDQAEGVTVNGDTLSIDKSLAASLSDGLTVAGDGQSPLALNFGEVDFSALSGPLQIVGVTSLQQQPLTQITAPSVQPLQITTSSAGATIGSMTVVGDLNVFALGPIVDEPGTSLKVIGDATFTSLRSVPAADFNEDGVVDNGDLAIWQSDVAAPLGSPVRSDANNDGVVDTADFDIWQNSLGEVAIDGGITLADTPTDEIAITGRATFRTLGGGLGAGLFDVSVGSNSGATTSFGSVSFTGDDVSIVETSTRGTTLTGDNIANTLSIESGGDLDDEDHTLRVRGDATLDADGSIALANVAGESVNIGDTDPSLALATFRGQSLSLGEGGDFGAELLRFESPGSVVINENGALANSLPQGMRLSRASQAGSVDLRSTGEITYDNATATQLRVGGDASFTAATELRLAEMVGSLLVVGDSNPSNGVSVATFAGGSIEVGRNGVFDAEGLTFQAPGAADIREGFRAGLVANNPPADTMLVGASEAATLRIETAGDLRDAAGASIVSRGGAEFIAGGEIVLNDQLGDSLLVASETSILTPAVATFRGGRVVVGAGLGFAADQLRFESLGDVRITEQVALGDRSIGMELTGVNRAESLELVSVAGITDAEGTSVRINGPAQFLADAAIKLADSAGDRLEIRGNQPGDPSEAFFQGSEIEVGGAGDFATEGLSFRSLGSVKIQEDVVSNDSAPGTRLTGENTARSLELDTDAGLTDDGDTTLRVTGDASFTAVGSIVLADDDSFAMENSVVVDGEARFVATGFAPRIDVGVVQDGEPARADARFGTLGFDALNGTVRIAEDDSSLLARSADGPNRATTLELRAAGSIGDETAAFTRIVGSATLIADGDVVLGDSGAAFDMGTPTPFFADQFLAIDAENVSVNAISGLNLRPGAEPIAGSYVVTAAGTVSQVGGKLAAERFAIASEEGAVLLTGLSITADSSDPTGNLSLHAGGEFDLAGLRPVGEFPLDLIPGDTITDFSPISIGPMGVTEPAAIGDGYAIVALVHGDATIGEVADATEAQAPRIGLRVTGEGNAFLQSQAKGAEPGDLLFTSRSSTGEGASSNDGTVVQMSGGVFTAVAAGDLSIDTTQPDQPTSGASRTTVLRSATGAVTSVAGFTTPDGITGETLMLIGPRFVLDPADDAAEAATTSLVLATTDFEQRVTAAIGSRGEEGLIVIVDWADVVQAFRPDLPASRVPLSPGLPGSMAGPEVIVTPLLDGITPEAGLAQQTSPPLDFRVVTIRHNYSEAFLPFNPLVNVLPTGLTVSNDPAINLFDQFQQTESEVGADVSFRDLNSNQNAVEASIISVQGYTLPLPRETPTPRPIIETPFVPTQETPVSDRRYDFEERVSVTASVEVILFGKIDPDDPTRWATDVPGEVWPMEWLGSGTTAGEAAVLDQIRSIKEYVDEGPFSEGSYRIVVETPRGQQPLEEWVKGDRDANEAATEEPVQEAPAEPNVDDGAATTMETPTIAAATGALLATTTPNAKLGRLMRRWKRSRSSRPADRSV